jgi:hypothetical protein
MSEGILGRLFYAGRSYAVVSELTRDPDPAPTHRYERDPQSGAGNCVCGAAEHHRRHPHDFWAAASAHSLCVCALPRGAKCHRTDALATQSAADESGDTRGVGG